MKNLLTILTILSYSVIVFAEESVPCPKKIQVVEGPSFNNLDSIAQKTLDEQLIREARNCNKKSIIKYLDQGVDINAQSSFFLNHNVRALNIAAKHCDVSFVSWLIEQGAEINPTHSAERSYPKPPIISAIEAQNTEVIAFFVGHPDIEINAEKIWKNTPLNVAINNGDKKTVNLLLGHPEVKIDKNPFSLLPHRDNLSQSVHYPEIFTMLLNHGDNLAPFSIKTIQSARKFIEVKLNKAKIDNELEQQKTLQEQLAELDSYESRVELP